MLALYFTPNYNQCFNIKHLLKPIVDNVPVIVD